MEEFLENLEKKFDINRQLINFKHFHKFYFGNKYLTSNICLV